MKKRLTRTQFLLIIVWLIVTTVVMMNNILGGASLPPKSAIAQPPPSPTPCLSVVGGNGEIVLPSNSNCYPEEAPSEPCADPCVIYAVIPAPGNGFEGIWEVDTCTPNAKRIKIVKPNGMWSAAVKSDHELYVHDDVNWQIKALDLDNASLSSTSLVAPNPAMALSEGASASGELYVDSNRDLLFSSGSGFDFVGTGQMAYIGDLVFSSEPAVVSPTLECRLFGGVGVPDPGIGANFVQVSRTTGRQRVIGNMSGKAVFGLAFDGQGGLWASESTSIRPANPNTGALGNPILVFPSGSTVMDLASYPCRGCLEPDLGDAPDSTNHFSATMTAYIGTQAGFPTVYDPTAGSPSGPKHAYPLDDHWLGSGTTAEEEADLFPDGDPTTNIVPTADTPDLDGHDDGLMFPVALPHCSQTTITFKVGAVDQAMRNQAHRYANVWFDFNRDGDWADTLSCQDPHRGTITVYEWAVQDLPLVGLNAGVNPVVAPLFDAYDPNYPSQTLWMRITLGEETALDPPGPSLPDGRGPSGGLRVGETEDYLLVPSGTNGEYGAS